MSCAWNAECTDRVTRRGLCERHYWQLRRDLVKVGHGLVDRRDEPPLILHCVCEHPLKIPCRFGEHGIPLGTVQCGRCYRAMFAADGTPINS